MLLLPGPEHKGNHVDEGWVVAGKRIHVAEQPDEMSDLQRQTTFTKIWDGAVVLVKYLEFTFRPPTIPKSILELGAGCGLTGIAAGVLYPDADVFITDLPAAVGAIRANIAKNASVLGPNLERVRSFVLDWAMPHDKGPALDLVLAADVVWLVDLIQPFLDTLQRITTANPGCVTLMSYQSRSKIVDERLFAGLALRNFSFVAVATDKKITVYRITLSSSHPG